MNRGWFGGGVRLTLVNVSVTNNNVLDKTLNQMASIAKMN